MRTLLVVVVLSGCLSRPSPDVPADGAPDAPPVSGIGAVCDVSSPDFCAEGLGLCVPTGDRFVCREQCNAVAYPHCAAGLRDQWADLFGDGNTCVCVPEVQ